MNGAESLLQTALAAGAELCFANPGTTEMPLVAALDRAPGLRAVLGLFEGVCTGAADGYARMSGRPALTLLHLGPGLANGIANLHNARRARSPVVNLIGDQASWHREADAPLSSDIASLAGTVGWVTDVSTSAQAPHAMAEALTAAQGPPSQVASLILPADAQWGPSDPPAAVHPPGRPREPDEGRLDEIVTATKQGRTGVLLGGAALREAGLRAAHRLAAATGWGVWIETFPSRQERGAGLPDFPRLPYFPEQARAALASLDQLVLAGAPAPVAFFGYPDGVSRLAPESCSVLDLADPGADAVLALEGLADLLGAPPVAPVPDAARPQAGTGVLDPAVLGATLAALQPEGAIVVDEAATSGLAYATAAAGAPRHTVLSLTGGAIGQGLPCATGAALACPDRPVIAFQADGSGLYTLQALWTQAREGLDVTTVICANRAYRILQVELARAGVTEPGPEAHQLMDLSHPSIDWTALATGFGVPARRVATAEELAEAFHEASEEPGPHLIEAGLSR